MKLCDAMEECNARGLPNCSKQLQKICKVQHDKKAHSITLLSGNRLLAKNFVKGGLGNIHSHWEQTVYRVVKQLNADAPVYAVDPENGNGEQCILHCTSLLPCDSLPLDTPNDIPLKTPQKNCQKQNTRQCH